MNPVQTHDYLDDGTYAVVLTVTDNHGAAATAATSVTIGNVTPYIQSASISTPPLPANVPINATVQVTYTDPGANDHPFVTVDWGDGTVSRDTAHVYATPGAYPVVVTVTDKDGASSSQPIATTVWVYDVAHIQPVPGYEVFDLGTLGGNAATPYAMNNNGDIVGSMTTTESKIHPFLWRNGTLLDLNPEGREGLTRATAINDAGWIAGPSWQEHDEIPMWREGVFSGFTPIPGSENGGWPVKVLESGDVILNISKHEYPTGVLIHNGSAVSLGGLYAPVGHSLAKDMNSHGQIVGSSAYQYSGAASYDFRAFLWQDGAMVQLANLGTSPCVNVPELQCGYSEANDITETGQIVGAAYNGMQLRAVSWDAEKHAPTDLGFGSASSRAIAINERGQIAGDGGWNGNDGYFRENGQVFTLGSLGGGGTQVVAMNEDGIVVGTSKTVAGEQHAFVWSRATGMRDLGAGQYGGRGVGSVVVSINARGDILGYAAPLDQWGRVSFGQTRAILWRRVN